MNDLATPRLFIDVSISGLILLSRTVYAADFCVAPDFASAVDSAEVIFSGEVTNVERVESGTTEVAEYVVKFRVETWWKGTGQAGCLLTEDLKVFCYPIGARNASSARTRH